MTEGAEGAAGAEGNRASAEAEPAALARRTLRGVTPATGTLLSVVGRARRFACDEGELWQLPAGAERIATRLVELGRAGVGGFARASGAGDLWLVRRGAPDLGAW